MGGRIAEGVRALRSEAGQALVEFALALPMLVFGLVGGLDLARAYAVQLAIINGARAGAESGTLAYWLTDAQITGHVLDELTRTPGMDPAAAIVTVTHPTISSVNYVQVNVRYTFRTIVPWPLVPNSTTFDRTTIFRKWP